MYIVLKIALQSFDSLEYSPMEIIMISLSLPPLPPPPAAV
jgi:hypothetical protein